MASSQTDWSSHNAQGEGQCNFKILIPASAVGSIMGRNGDVVNNLEIGTSTKIMISGLKDCYPGTRERVCLISGNVENILSVNRIIMKRLHANPDLCYKARSSSSRRDASWRPKQVKIIIPQCTASKIIGKGGSNIEKMKAESGSFIQLSRKAFPIVLRERCVTVSGELSSNDVACQLILQIIAPDTDTDYYKNVSYSQANFPLPNAYMSGPPFAKATYNFKGEVPESSITRRDMLLFLETFKETLKNMSFPDHAISATADSLLTLCNHRVLDVCLSMLINWFYPRAFAVYERNGGVPGFGRAQSSGVGFEKPPRDFSRSMFAVADPEPPFQPMRNLPAGEPKLYAESFLQVPSEFSWDVDYNRGAPSSY